MQSFDKEIKLYKKGLSLRKLSKIVGVPRETIRIGLIKSGLKLRKSKRYVPILHTPNYEINVKSAELLAMHAGDGSLDKTGRWCFSSNKNDEKLVIHIADLFGEVIGVTPNINYYPYRIQVRSSHRQTTTFFEKFYERGKKAYTVSLPDEIIESMDPRVKLYALSGLFSTDGSFSFKRKGLTPRIEFRVKSKKLRDQFAKLAQSFGFEYNCNTQKHRTGIIYTAYIERIDDTIRWMKQIGSKCDTHIKRYNNWHKLRKRRGSRAWPNAVAIKQQADHRGKIQSLVA